MGDKHDGQPAVSIDPPNDSRNVQLVMEIEKGGRLIQKQDFRFLGQCPGNHRSLPLSAGDVGHQPMAEVRHVQISHRLHRHGAVPITFPSHPPRSIVMGIPAHQHHFIDRKRKRLLRLLGHEGHAAGNLGLGKRTVGLPEQFNRPPLRRHDSHEDFQQGTFPGSIGAEYSQHFTRGNRDGDIVQRRKLNGCFPSPEPETHGV